MIILALITLTGAIFRGLFINRAIEYDEGYTYIEFARHSLAWIMSSYYVVNNHVFHTILVHFSTAIFGNTLWALRLPAFTAGTLLIPLVYWVARQIYGKWVGIFSACLTAIAPIQILISTRARGYSILTLISLAVFLIALYVTRHKNRFAWILMSLLSALGFYTLPLMLYPYGVIYTWLFFNGFTGLTRQTYQDIFKWIKYILISGILTGLTTCLLYLPILLNNDVLSKNGHGSETLPKRA